MRTRPVCRAGYPRVSRYVLHKYLRVQELHQSRQVAETMSGKMMEDINAALGVCWKRRAGFGSQRELLQSVAHYVDERRDESNQAAQYRSINTFLAPLVSSQPGGLKGAIKRAEKLRTVNPLTPWKDRGSIRDAR